MRFFHYDKKLNTLLGIYQIFTSWKWKVKIVASRVSTNWAQKYGRLFLAILRPLPLYVYLSLQLNREARFFYMHVIQSIHWACWVYSRHIWAGLHGARSELKPVWNLKPLWKFFPFTWQFHYGQPWDLKPLSKIIPFTWRFHCGNFLSSKLRF